MLLPDQNVRDNAEKQLSEAALSDYVSLFVALLVSDPFVFRLVRVYQPSYFIFPFFLIKPTYVSLLASELANEQSQSFIRNAAGLALKNSLTSSVSFRLLLKS